MWILGILLAVSATVNLVFAIAVARKVYRLMRFNATSTLHVWWKVVPDGETCGPDSINKSFAERWARDHPEYCRIENTEKVNYAKS